MKIEEGAIIAIPSPGLAEVKVGRHSDCMACGSCPGSENIVVTAVDPLGVEVGQHVKFEVRESNIVVGAFVCFIMPLLITAIGAIGGHYYGIRAAADAVHTAVIGGIIGFLVGVGGVKVFDRSLRNDQTANPKIIEICK